MTRKITAKCEDVSGSEFEDLNMAGTTFTNINLTGARFHDINFSDVNFSAAQLGGTVFRHIGPPPHEQGVRQRPVTFEEMTLCDSVFRDVDLSNVRLEKCDMAGMTIDGVLVTDLLRAYKSQR